MSDFIRVSAIKESLTECPICTEHFNDSSRLPRRMPCCVQSICQPCLLELYNTINKKLSCPLCRHEHQLPEGITSLPIEPLIAKILDHLKIQKGLRLPCTDCPDGNEAIARCDDCCVFLCEECHKAHTRTKYSRDHKTVTFEEMKGRPLKSFRRLHQCMEHQQAQQFYCCTCAKVICASCTIVDHDKGKDHIVMSVDEAHQDKATSTEHALIKLDEKAQKLSQSVEDLQKKKANIQTSIQKATYDINHTFDNMIKKLHDRRTILLSDVEEKSSKDLKPTEQALKSTTTLLIKVRSSTEYTREMREKADKIEDLQLMASSADSLTAMLEESPQDAEFDRTGVSFVPHQEKQITLLMESFGVVRNVTFTSRERPAYVPATDIYSNITMVPAELPLVPDQDMKIPGGDGDIICPNLEWDVTTASPYVTVSKSVITNTTPAPPSPNTGCRMQSSKRIVASRPLVIRRGQRVLYHVNVKYSLKQVIQENKTIFESALTSSPVDTNWNQPTGLSVRVAACRTHKQQLCLWVWYYDQFLTDIPLTRNRVDASNDLYLAFVVENDKIHVVDVKDAKVLTTVSDAGFNRPLWIMMCVAPSMWADMKGELLSGNKNIVTQKIDQLVCCVQ